MSLFCRAFFFDTAWAESIVWFDAVAFGDCVDGACFGVFGSGSNARAPAFPSVFSTGVSDAVGIELDRAFSVVADEIQDDVWITWQLLFDFVVRRCGEFFVCVIRCVCRVDGFGVGLVFAVHSVECFVVFFHEFIAFFGVKGV